MSVYSKSPCNARISLLTFKINSRPRVSSSTSLKSRSLLPRSVARASSLCLVTRRISTRTLLRASWTIFACWRERCLRDIILSMYYLSSSPVIWDSFRLFLCRYGSLVLGKNSRTTIDSVFGYIRLFGGDRFLDRLIEALLQIIISLAWLG
jgi:hypothetical protein